MLTPRVKLHWNDECRMSNVEWWNRFAQSFKLTEYIIRCSMLDFRCSTFISFFSLIRLAVFFGQRPHSCKTT
ncbi:hypothetical protein D1AOALGA4SA_8147 [Olavius algarvensis Delta 1 endosymbiont]|nr:hypothetical protein D1AOALGA4SA_8147 [Olavius algarvensis Delta 1 endosymbiont]